MPFLLASATHLPADELYTWQGGHQGVAPAAWESTLVNNELQTTLQVPSCRHVQSPFKTGPGRLTLTGLAPAPICAHTALI